MRIVVCVKEIPDPTILKFNLETNTFENIRYIMDPVDEVAVSEAIRIRKRSGGEVITISLGPPRTEEVLRTCLKMGVDEAIHISDEGLVNLDAYASSIVLAKMISKLQYDFILCGKESMDESSGFLGAGIAEWLNLPLVAAVTRLDIFADTRTARIHRRVKGGDREILESPLPAVFTVESSLCKPVYPPLRTILTGRKKNITKVDAKSLGIEPRSLEPTITVISISQPKPRLKKTATIDSKLPPHERIKLITAGGVGQKGSKTIEKPPQAAASEIIQFLIANGIISK